MADTREDALVALDELEELVGTIDMETSRGYQRAVDLIEAVRAALRTGAQGEPVDRLETGVIQCGDDWPGVFIRGDEAMALGMALDRLAESVSDPEDFETLHHLLTVECLHGLLSRAATRHPEHRIDQRIVGYLDSKEEGDR